MTVFRTTLATNNGNQFYGGQLFLWNYQSAQPQSVQHPHEPLNSVAAAISGGGAFSGIADDPAAAMFAGDLL